MNEKVEIVKIFLDYNNNNPMIYKYYIHKKL